jgi:hypothetical protein
VLRFAPQVRDTGAFGIIVAMSEPFAAFYDEPPDFVRPGDLLRWKREEARERAEEARKEQERIERAEIRAQLALHEARMFTLGKGLPWDPQAPFRHFPDVYARADALMALQDAEQRDADRRALQQAGLDHLLGDLPLPGSSSSGDAIPPASRSVNGMVAATPRVAARPLASRIRAAFTRWESHPSGEVQRSRALGCGCVACTGEDVHRSDPAAGLPELTRSCHAGATIR